MTENTNSDDEDTPDPVSINNEDILADEDNEECYVCEERGKTETWYRCVSCGVWAHKACSGADSPKNYQCDSCCERFALRRKSVFYAK